MLLFQLCVLGLSVFENMKDILTGNFRVTGVGGAGALRDAFTCGHVEAKSVGKSEVQFEVNGLTGVIEFSKVFNSGTVEVLGIRKEFKIESDPPFIITKVDLETLGEVQVTVLSASTIRVIYAKDGDVLTLQLEKPVSLMGRLMFLYDSRMFLVLAVPMILVAVLWRLQPAPTKPKDQKEKTE